MKKRLLNTIIIGLMFLILVSIACASGEIVQEADKLNYWGVETHTVTVTNTGAATTNATIAPPAGFTITGASGGCSQVSTDAECILANGASGTYTFTSPGGSASEYQVDLFQVSTNNSYTGNNVSMLKIQCGEIFHTLVEFGRGRGNYFYNSGSGKAGSGQTETGCNYLPNGTFIELNFLHKVYNVKQYFNVVADAYNATYTCTYPNDTIVRQHLDTSITRANDWTVDYEIDEIGGSWERFGYLGMQFDSGAYTTGQNLTINCTSIQYQLPVAGGNMSCSEDSFNLEFRNREPFTVSSAATGTLYNGTQEVAITYTLTNSESYTVSDAVFEISAPTYGQFIGTRGELWGYAQDIYRFERSDFLPGETESVTLVVRFDTSNAGAMDALNHTDGVEVEYTTCWEYNAYNPAEYIQDLVPGTGSGTGIGNITVNMSETSTIINIINYISNIYDLQVTINNTLTSINGTIFDILNLTQIINASTWNLSYNVWTYSNRNLTYYPANAAGGGGGGTGTVACRWNTTTWYSNTSASTTQLVYGSNIFRIDFPNVYNGTVDSWQACHRSAPSATTGAGDILEVYVCNDYNNSGDPHDDPGCAIIDAEDPTEANWIADHLRWECDTVLSQEVYGTNITMLYKCDNCAGTSDSWQMAVETAVNLNYTYNSSDIGATWDNVTGEGLVDWSWCVPIDFGAEVWEYNNRTLTDYNFSILLDQFNCTDNETTNKMCELLYGINITTYNMYQTIQSMNLSINNIGGNISLIFNNTQYIIQNLDCDGANDSTICDMLLAMNVTLESIEDYVIAINLTVENLETTVTTINSTLNSLNASLFIMNASWHARFDDIDGNLTILYNISIDLQDLLNCTNISAQDTDSVCNRLERVENYTLVMNSTVTDILNLVNYINGTRWLNYSVQDILDAINNISISATTNLTSVLTEIRRLREFDEELVFLVTDAFNMQQRASDDVERGDLNSALDNLNNARTRLDEAAVRLDYLKGQEQVNAQGKWWIWLLLVSLIVVVLVYLFQKVPEEEPPKYKFN